MNKKNRMLKSIQDLIKGETGIKEVLVEQSKNEIFPIMFTPYGVLGEKIQTPTLFTNIDEYYYLSLNKSNMPKESILFRQLALNVIFKSNFISKIEAAIVTASNTESINDLSYCRSIAKDAFDNINKKYPGIFDIELYFNGSLFSVNETLVDLIFIIACEIRNIFGDDVAYKYRDYDVEEGLLSSYLFFNTLLSELSNNIINILIKEVNEIYFNAGEV